MSVSRITILLIEDTPEDAQAMRDILAKETAPSFEVRYADRLSRGLEELASGPIDVVLLDLQLPDSRGVGTLLALRRQSPTVPIVVLTASDDDALASQALQNGAQDYLVKGYAQVYPKLLVRSMRYAIDRSHADLEIRRAHAQTDRLLASITSILIGVGPKGRITHWNHVAEATFGRSVAQMHNQPLADGPIPWDSARILRGIEECQQHDAPVVLDDVTFTRPDGQSGFLGISIIPIHELSDGALGFLLFGADITEQRHAESERARLQEQLVQAQKMEMIGRFAGGIAHDFNNFLQVILGFALLIQARHGDDAALLNDLREIMHAAESGSVMVKQLLAFSRRHPLQPKVFEINQAIHNTARLLQQFVGENIRVELQLAADGLLVKLDPTGLEQILMNFVSNARDAMPDGGLLTIRTQRVAADAAFLKTHTKARPGDYIRLSIRDSGMGMDPALAAHIFEPFFTTKQQGKGTGLGLAVVYGLVEQHDGFVEVESSPGQGTGFHVYLPMQTGTVDAIAQPTKATARATARQTSTRRRVLVVDDEASIRTLCQRILAESYDVTTASSGGSALELLAQDAYDALLTDIRMPNMDGLTLLDHAAKRRPDMKLLAMTGSLTLDIEHRLNAVKLDRELIRKPFTPVMLQDALRHCF